MSTDLLATKVQALLQSVIVAGASQAARALSGMIGQPVTLTVSRISKWPLAAVADHLGGPEAHVAGIYLASEGSLRGHIMLILSLEDALRLVDMLMELPEGTTRELDSLARSALGEVGNLAASFFLSSVADAIGATCRPSPPAVIVDMAGAVLDIMLVTAGALGDHVLLLEAIFCTASRHMRLHFWMVPDLATQEDAIYSCSI